MNITGGKYNSRKVASPETEKVRPTLSKIRQSVFNSLGTMINFENSTFLDLFSGSGIISLEAISRDFKHVTTVEKDKQTVKTIKNNFLSLNETPNLVQKDAILFLNSTELKFDVIYIDPPYNNSFLYQKSLDLILEKNILNKEGIIIVEYKKNQKEFNISDKFKIIKEKTFGDTSLIILTVLI